MNLVNLINTQANLNLIGLENKYSLLQEAETASENSIEHTFVNFIQNIFDFNSEIKKGILPGIAFVSIEEDGSINADQTKNEIQQLQNHFQFDFQSSILSMLSLYEFVKKNNDLNRDRIANVFNVLNTFLTIDVGLNKLHTISLSQKFSEIIILKRHTIEDINTTVRSLDELLSEYDFLPRNTRDIQRLLKIHIKVLEQEMYEFEDLFRHMPFFVSIADTGGLEMYHFVPFFETYFPYLKECNLVDSSYTFLKVHNFDSPSRVALYQISKQLMEQKDAIDSNSFSTTLIQYYEDLITH